MKHLRNIRRAALLLVASVVLLAAPAVSAAASTAGPGTANSGAGWIRLAHLSPYLHRPSTARGVSGRT